ncbi:MAG: SH3 domain-containing protein, partial [Lachnospiraceae bacterium]|nr:SH3 domain-containing protein [Lachnospiraceae bacterium]
MKKRNQRALWCLLSAMGFSILAGGSVMAAEDGEIRDKITIPYEQEDAWDKVAMINDDAVDTGVNIRATADKDGEVVGYLYHGMAAWVIDKGDEWTEISSGDITGFVKNDYLLYGRDVIGLADHYGYEGVATTWDDVKLFSAEDADSDVMDVLETGAYFILLQDEGHWLTVQVGTDGLGYVSSEDVSKVLILDTAVDKDELYEGNDLVPMNRETEADTDTEETDTD